MKSFRQILGEVAQPKSAEERAFKDMHSYETIPHPVALDHQFTGAIGADDLPREKAKRLADQEGDANYDTSYDDAFEYEGPSFDESVELDESIKKHMSPYDAREFLKKHKAHNKDFHGLPSSSASAMHDKAKELKYKKSRSASGSTGRMFHAALQKHADSYKGARESVELGQAEDLQELSISTLKRYIQKKVGRNARDSEGLKAYYALTKVPAFNNLGKADKEAAMKVIKDQEALVKKSEKSIDIAKLKATAKADKLGVDMVFGKDGKAMGMSKMREQADQAIVNRLSEGSAMAKSAALSKASAPSKSGKAKVSLKKAPWDKNEEVDLEEGFSPKQIEQLKKAYASMPDRLPVDAAQKMGAILKGRSKEELIAIARADIKWLSTTAATNLIMQGVKAKEING